MPFLPANDLTVGASGELGGRTLLPGVYHFSAAADLTGALQLNANFKNNVFWVFQIGTSLTSAANATVTIINPGTNGGSDDAIFWVADTGALTFGNNNTLVGNYIANTSISMGAVTENMSGGARFLALTGSVTFTGAIVANSDALGTGNGNANGGLTFGTSGSVVDVNHFLVTVLSPETAGTAFNVTVTAQDASNSTVTDYSGTVAITSTDGLAVVPGNAVLSGGVGTFPVTLNTGGISTVTATDSVASSISGTSAPISVVPAPTPSPTPTTI